MPFCGRFCNKASSKAGNHSKSSASARARAPPAGLLWTNTRATSSCRGLRPDLGKPNPCRRSGKKKMSSPPCSFTIFPIRMWARSSGLKNSLEKTRGKRMWARSSGSSGLKNRLERTRSKSLSPLSWSLAPHRRPRLTSPRSLSPSLSKPASKKVAISLFGAISTPTTRPCARIWSARSTRAPQPCRWVLFPIFLGAAHGNWRMEVNWMLWPIASTVTTRD